MAKKKKPAGRRPAADQPFRDNWPEQTPRMVKLAAIKPYPNNPRTHPPAQIKLLAEILRKYGPDQNIVVDEAGVILKGHGRLAAAEMAGFEVYPVIRRAGMAEADKQAMRIADNQMALLSGWDATMLRQEIADLRGGDYPIELLGFSEHQLEQFETEPAAPQEFQQFGEDIDTEHECPSCHYRWSGFAGLVPKTQPPAKSRGGGK